MNAITQAHLQTFRTIDIRPLQPAIGAEISGIDLRQPLSEEQRDEIKSALLRYKVIFFRDQDLDAAQHAAEEKKEQERAAQLGGGSGAPAATPTPSPVAADPAAAAASNACG